MILPARNFGKTLERQEKYERLHEMVQIVRGLWGEYAWIRNADAAASPMRRKGAP